MRIVRRTTISFLFVLAGLVSGSLQAQSAKQVDGWQMQDSLRVQGEPALVSSPAYRPQNWYTATVPGTVLTTLVANGVYPEPLYGENMRSIPESLNKTSYWYRTTFTAPAPGKTGHTWLHFGGINYFAQVWVNGQMAGTIKGAFVRGDFDITDLVKPGKPSVLAVLVAPQPHPGIPHEHTQVLGLGLNGGETAIDGPTFLSTIGWDWMPAIRDRDTGIWLPVTLDTTGPVILKDPLITSDLAASHQSAELHVSVRLQNLNATPVTGMLTGTIQLQNSASPPVTFSQAATLAGHATEPVNLDSKTITALHVVAPQLWWPNGYGPQNLYRLTLSFAAGRGVSNQLTQQFGIRKIEYQVADSENLTISVNGVRVMVRGGNWGMDEAMKRVTRDRLDAQFHMHALANMNLIRNWVGQSTSPDFYDMADKYGMLLWDEFFQPNPSDGPDVTDIQTYLTNVTDKVMRYRNHPAIAVWCARNEGYPPPALGAQLKELMGVLDPTRLYQANSADGRGVSSHGPYYWRAPRFLYALNESFKTETGSVSIPTIESIQAMMPQKDWETINDDWAQHDMAAGAQRGDEFPATLAARYGHIRNLADFVRKGQLATYETFRAMYEGRNAQMFKATTGVITWMSSPAQPSFVWQLYHYDLEPNAALYAVKKAAETVHIQFNEQDRDIEVVNNRPDALTGLKVKVAAYDLGGALLSEQVYPVAQVAGSTTFKVAQLDLRVRLTQLYFLKLYLLDGRGQTVSTNLYWQNVAQEDFSGLVKLPVATLEAETVATESNGQTHIALTLHNRSRVVALLTHVQLHQKASGKRVLPVFYSDNYLSLVPGESTTITIDAATRDLAGQAPVLAFDGYNVAITPADGPVTVENNLNASPLHWPASNIVPDK